MLPANPLLRQIVGAVIGGTLALGLYVGYKAVNPTLQAYINIYRYDQGARFSKDTEDLDYLQFERQESRNREIMKYAAPDAAFENIADRANEIQTRYGDQGAEFFDQMLDEPVDDSAIEPDVMEPMDAMEPDIMEPVDAMQHEDAVIEAMPASDPWEQQMEHEERVPYEGTQPLPDSGLGTWLLALLAAALTAVTRYRKHIVSLCAERVS